jgi:hypothetical protein
MPSFENKSIPTQQTARKMVQDLFSWNYFALRSSAQYAQHGFEVRAAAARRNHLS